MNKISWDMGEERSNGSRRESLDENNCRHKDRTSRVNNLQKKGGRAGVAV